jgi:hypothetical protein
VPFFSLNRILTGAKMSRVESVKRSFNTPLNCFQVAPGLLGDVLHRAALNP